MIKSKELNLIYFNVPESVSDIVAERMKQDYERLRSSYGGEFDHNEITSLYRIGKKADKSRPIAVRFKSVDSKNKYLKKSAHLKVKENHEDIPVYVSIDRTMKQRAAHRKLVDELKNRRREREENLVIRNNKIVTNFQREHVAQRTSWSSLFKE